jgi:hypothetical protein
MAAIDESLKNFKVTNALEIQEQEGVVSFRIPLYDCSDLVVIIIKDNRKVLRVKTEHEKKLISKTIDEVNQIMLLSNFYIRQMNITYSLLNHI